jgi:TRAP-type C4-dicarboxylate transport system substrate-binding protein
MYVLDLPFLFRDHDHATKVLEGKVGGQLLAGLEKKHVKGLAFTYSGGYRILPANTPIASLEQFKGMKIRTSQSPVAQDTFKALGATPVPMDLDDVANATKQGKISASESTYPRFYELKQNQFSKVLNDTKHSLFLTSIVINQEFWKSLTPEQQKAVRDAAVSAARLERQQSIADAEVTKAQCVKDGIQVVSLPEPEQEKFKALMQPIYKKYEKYFSGNLVAQIQND